MKTVRATFEFEVDDSWGETNEMCIDLTKREMHSYPSISELVDVMNFAIKEEQK